MTESRTPPAPTELERWSWCGFDFANSSFTTVIVTVVYARWFVYSVVADETRGEILWGVALAVSNLLVLMSGPLIGALADRHGLKKRALAVSWIVCCSATAALSAFGRGDVVGAFGVFLIANTAYAAGENLIAAFLPELAPPSGMGRLSARGWSLGYFGGLSSLALALVMVKQGWTAAVPVATAGFFLVAGIPTMLWVYDRGSAPVAPERGGFRAAFAQSMKTLHDRERFQDLFRLLVSLFFQQAGVCIVIDFSALYAKSAFGMSNDEVIELFVALQIAAAAGAWTFGRVQDRLGSRRTLVCTIVIWLAAVATAVLAHDRAVFQAASILAGIAMGSSQSAGRALVGIFAPRGRSAEWFGLWGLSTKAAAVAGPACIALLRGFDVSLRVSMGATIIFFVLGWVFLRSVDEARGRNDAMLNGAAA